MNEIIQALECNATNSKEHFCILSEKELVALKELSRRDYEEYNQLKSNWKALKEWANHIPKQIHYIDKATIINKLNELEKENEK